MLYFFTFLYYTDPGSTFFTLLMYYLGLKHKHFKAAVSGVVAVLYRQTNIVWVVFVAGNTIIDKLLDYMSVKKKDLNPNIVQEFSFINILFQQILRDIRLNRKRIFALFWNIVKTTWAYVLVGFGFLAFIIVNGSIVVGAKNDHQAGLHFPQILYFLSFTCAFSFMHILSLHAITSFFKFVFKRPVITIIVCITFWLMISKFTYAHRYLLSDNRHYTFYIWSRVFRRHDLVKYALIPGYMFALWTICNLLQHCNILWKLVFSLCMFMNLVPSMLLEFRYFIIPYLLLRLHIKNRSYSRTFMELVVYICINAVTLYIFLYKPFKWDNETAIQRFMW